MSEDKPKYQEDRRQYTTFGSLVPSDYDSETFSYPSIKNNLYSYKKRGFEKISEKQWNNDYNPLLSKSARTMISYSEIKLPKRATSHSAGYDVFTTLGFVLEPNESIAIPTGFKVYMLEDEKFVIHSRSGLGFKYFVRLANNTGIVDSDFFNNESNEGHCWVKIRNEGDRTVIVNAGEAIAQGIFEKYLLADGDDFTGEKRTGGFGSTDKK